MIKPEFTFLQMKIESVFLHPSETNQTSLGIGPKTFYSINMTMFISKFVFSVLHSIVLLIAKVHKTIIATPAVRMNNAFRVYTTSNNTLQSSPGAAWNYFCINTALSFNEAKYNGFTSGSSPSKTTNTAGTQITFINLNLARNRRFSCTGKGNSFSYSWNNLFTVFRFKPAA